MQWEYQIRFLCVEEVRDLSRESVQQQSEVVNRTTVFKAGQALFGKYQYSLPSYQIVNEIQCRPGGEQKFRNGGRL
jgi:hypothetical protein